MLPDVEDLDAKVALPDGQNDWNQTVELTINVSPSRRVLRSTRRNAACNISQPDIVKWKAVSGNKKNNSKSLEVPNVETSTTVTEVSMSETQTLVNPDENVPVQKSKPKKNKNQSSEVPNVSTSTTVLRASTYQSLPTVIPQDNASVKKSKCKSTIKYSARNIVSKKQGVKRSIRGDGVDQRCALLKIKYKKYEGTSEPKNVLHFSQFPYRAKKLIPKSQNIPGKCVLCPQQKFLLDKKECIRHYNAIHISKLIVVSEKTCLYCKCSAVRSRGSDDMTRISHYHCPMCHWPPDTKIQIGQHIYTKHKSVALGDYSHLMH